MNEKKLLELAHEQFREAYEGGSSLREALKEDLKIFDGEGIWPEQLRMIREGNPKGARPCLNISDLGPRVHQVTNDFRQERPAIKIRPVDDKADVDTAKIFNGLARHVEQQSDADIAYETANFYQTVGGYGFFRMTEEMYEGSPELFIRSIPNPMSVDMDPYALDPVGCDQRYCFVSENIPRAEFEREYPGVETGGWEEGDENGWATEDSVRVAEWFHIEEKSANRIKTPAGELSEEAYWEEAKTTGQNPEVLGQHIDKRKVCMWRKVVGYKILKTVELPICYVPVFRMAGEMYIKEGKVVMKGIVRDSRDAVRMVSYMFSNYVEAVALQPKAPFIGSAGQFSGFEDSWNGANTDNAAFLEYNSIDAEGNPAPPPQRATPPMASQGLMQGLVMAKDALKDTSGMGAASLGQKGNETSGKAIIARQRESDVSTFHIQDNAAKAVRHLGRVFVMWAPKVYSEPKTARIIGEDGNAEQAFLDPNQEESKRKVPQANGSIKTIYNLGVGRYDVVASVGPSYSTKRVEQAEAMEKIFQSNPDTFKVLGDIYMETQDGPGYDRMARRLKAMLPPEVAQADDEDEQAIPPQIKAQLEQMQGQLQEGASIVQEQGQELEQLRRQLESKDAEIAAKIYAENEQTDRTKITAAKDIEIAGMNNDTKLEIEGLRGQVDQMNARQEQLFAWLMQSQQPDQQGADFVAEHRMPEEPENEFEGEMPPQAAQPAQQDQMPPPGV